jgi:protein TonB
MKLLLVLPAAAFVFFAISAYKEIPAPTVMKTIQLDPTVTTEPVSPSAAIVNTEIKKQIKAEDLLAPPPPPPPPPAEKSSEKATEEVKTISEVLTEENEPEPFVVVEEMPMFPGGDVELLRYIGENTQYPLAAKEKNIQGRVIIRFCVTAKGSVSQMSVLKGVSPELDAEALRVVGTLPGFNPGKQGGKPVPVWYMVPITFTLK